MSKNAWVVFGIVVVALLCYFVPVVAPVLFGMGVQNGAISRQLADQLLQSVIFIGITKFNSGNLLVSVVGLSLTIYFRPTDPKKFRYMFIAFGLILISTLLNGFSSAWVQINVSQMDAMQSRVLIPFAFRSVAVVSYITSWILLFIVLFSKKVSEPALNS